MNIEKVENQYPQNIHLPHFGEAFFLYKKKSLFFNLNEQLKEHFIPYLIEIFTLIKFRTQFFKQNHNKPQSTVDGDNSFPPRPAMSIHAFSE